MDCLMVRDRAPLLEVVLNRPEKYNAINDQMLEGLTEQLVRFAGEPNLRLFLLRAEGRYFSAGGDIRSSLFPDVSHGSPQRFRQWLQQSQSSLSRLSEIIERIEKPLVVAHNGPCLGGALELSLAFDFRLASAKAAYALPENRLGAIPSAGGIARLTRLVGPHWARWLLLAGQTIGADKAERIGLVHAVYPAADFPAAVEAFCSEVLDMPPEAAGAAKLAIELAADLDLPGARNLERLVAGSLVFGNEFEHQLEAARLRVATGKTERSGDRE